MKRTASNAVRLLLASMLAVLGLIVVQAAAVPAAPTAQTLVHCGDTSSFQRVNLSGLPSQATRTVHLIEQGGPFPYPQDGTVFDNREGVLPGCPRGYYHEYTVPTPGSGDRGARRFVVGNGGEYFYTGNHYETFKLTDIHA